MSEQLHFFAARQGCTAVALPFNLEEVVAEWAGLRSRMIRRVHGGFSRDEWGYLVAFLDPGNLMAPYIRSFGAPLAHPDRPMTCLARPRGPVAAWLPNNVSLLGPLTLVLLSLTGNLLHLKGGSQGQDLAGTFLSFALENLPEGALKRFLSESVRHEVFGRDDPRHREMAVQSRVRVVFGSDAAVQAVHALPHPPDSVGFSFSERRSEAWLEEGALTDEVLVSLIRVFAIYGQAGCTSPARVVLLDQPSAAALALRDRLLALWPKASPRDPAANAASENVMARQWAAALGWDSALAPRNAAVLAAGDPELAPIPSPMFLPIVASTLERALGRLPDNIQTVGHAVLEPGEQRWLTTLARTRVKRFVPVARMHHFGPVWDGEAFWQRAFEMVEVVT